MQLPGCEHTVCIPCAASTLAIDPAACPAPCCSTRLPSSTKLPTLVRPAPTPAGCPSVLLEYGNTAESAGGQGKMAVTAFLKVVSAVGTSVGTNVIKSVGFDINPTYPGSAPTAKTAPFELTRSMAGRFPCDFIIMWDSKLTWQPLRIGYTVVHGEARHRRRLRVVVVPLEGGGKKLVETKFELGGPGGEEAKVPIAEIGRRVA